MNHQRVALAAILGVPLALLMVRPASIQSEVFKLILGCVFIGTFVTESRSSQRLGYVLLGPAILAALCGVLTLAFLAFAYDHQAPGSAPDIPLLSGGHLSYRSNPDLPYMIVIYGFATFFGIVASMVAKEPLAAMIGEIAKVDPRRIKSWFVGLSGAAVVILALLD